MLTNEQKNRALDILNRCGIDSPIDYFRGNLEETLEELATLTKATASALHEDWRKGYAAQNTNENGEVNPRWKKIKDKDFIERLDPNNLPSNIRNNDGVYEIDIANTPFENLSSDWQYENGEAAKIASGLAIRARVEPLSREEVGDIIHSEWLARNDWAKTDATLGLPYKDLPESEKVKDDRQYQIACQIREKILGQDGM